MLFMENDHPQERKTLLPNPRPRRGFPWKEQYAGTPNTHPRIFAIVLAIIQYVVIAATPLPTDHRYNRANVGP